MKKFDRSLLPVAPDFEFEKPLWMAGLHFVAGIDEAGRGALAGPVYAAVLIFPPDPDLLIQLAGVRDSKELNPAKRQFWQARLRRLARDYGIGSASNLEIDTLGIVPAIHLAIQRALEQLEQPPEHLLLDYMARLDVPVPQTVLVKGDARSISIAAASILAKTARDETMRQLDRQFAGYGFALHKGYGTQMHRQAIARLGLSPVHRRSFRLKT
jgi:ribonuclease HII